MANPATPLTASAGSEDAMRTSFARIAYGVLVYTVFVILFGAVVRITGSGAGCGQHWPTCQGELTTIPSTTAMAIEYTHRLTSGLSGVFIAIMAVLAFRRFPAGHAVRSVAVASVVLLVVEALLGRALVKNGLVEHDTSVARAVVMSVHLVNTSFLAAAVALTGFVATHRMPRRWLPVGPLEWTLLGVLGGTLVVSVTGALTALGDTLYPVDTARDLAARLAADQSATATFLERGRALHPVVAVTLAAVLVATARKIVDGNSSPEVRRAAHIVIALAFIQVSAGIANIALSAPGWMQVVHLAIATTLWLALVLFYATVVGAGV